MNKQIKIGYILGDFSQLVNLKQCDLVLVKPRDKILINFKSELSGKSGKLINLATLSKGIKGKMLVFAKTENFGILQDTIITFYHGKILSLSDKNMTKSHEKVTFGLKTCQVSDIKCGILVGDDILHTEYLNTFSHFNCDLVLNILGESLKIKEQSVVETLSFIFGMQIILLGEKSLSFMTQNGKVKTINSEFGAFNIDISNYYYEITKKKRGLNL